MTIKDESNKRIFEELVPHIEEVMDNEDRGFIFCPLPQIEGEHRTFCLVKTKGLENFWAGLVMLVSEAKRNLPEEMYEEFEEGFCAMVRCCVEQSFPMLQDQFETFKGEIDELRNRQQD